jgi:small-conductance mechanosensitive channel
MIRRALLALLLGVAVLASAPAAAPAQVSAARDSAARDSSTHRAPVIMRGDTVLVIPGAIGPFTAGERAAAVADRVRGLARSTLDSLLLVDNGASTDIVGGTTILMTITDADAAALGRRRAELSVEFRDALWREVSLLTTDGLLRAVAYGLLWTSVATGLLIVIVVLFRRGHARLESALAAGRDGGIPALRIRNLELVSADSLANFATAVLRAVRTLLFIVLTYFYLVTVLSFFPWTERYAESLLSHVLTPLLRVLGAIVAYLPNVIVIAIMIVVTRYALRLIRAVFGAVERGVITLGGFEREWADPTYKIVRFLVIAFVLVVVFPYLPGANSEAFKGVSLFLGVLISLGSSSAISNVVAGVVLTYTRAFSLGDRVRIGETTGDVIAKTLLVTRLRTIKNVDTTIPNAMVLSAATLNYSAMARSRRLILNSTVTIGYDAPWRQVHELLIAAARATPGVLDEPAPFVLQTALGDFSVSYEINAHTADAQAMATTYSELHAAIQDAFTAAGVEIMSPRYHALRDGNAVTLPPQHLPEHYVAPSFRVRQEPPV